MEADERARLGLFLAMQYPVEVPGVSVMNFLRTSLNAIRGEDISPRDFIKLFDAKSELLGLRPLLRRPLPQQRLLGRREEAPRDPPDGDDRAASSRCSTRPTPGLDVDALKVVSEGVNTMRGPELGVLIITHYTRILRYITPDVVHVMFEGRIARRAARSWPSTSRRTATWSSGPPRRPRPRPGRDGDPDEHRRRDRRRGAPGGLPDPRRGRSTARRWSTSTRPPRRRSRRPCSTRWRPTTARPTPTCTAASTSSRPRPPTRFEAGRDAVARLVNAPREGVILTKNASEAINLVAWAWGVRDAARGRRGARHRDGAPLQHRARGRSWPRSPAPQVRVRPGHPRRRARHGRLPRPSCPSAPAWSAVAHASNVLGTINPVAEITAPGPRGRAPSCWSTARRACPTCRSTSRPSAATSSRSPATRCSARPASACSWGAPRCSRRWSPSSAAAR